ncbi:2'-5' RNA ligase family protein [Nonomuraea aurantiaca]|uniref:2'-5' RNA ligase family protein n=1 Tax=Nonomuraea aurantiaca TaxID=2878562 RepID=UPI001CD935E8|nr:2'-5' RNA ligase family protein [Nonomuraea aurantiaca]MCA2223496.1 2'-5' RNA ligase family protein [Nonomuraea aurantiaca]
MSIHDADEVRSHWWPREGWRPGRLVYTWHLTFEHARQLHQLAERYQAALATIEEHNPIPARWLHLTVQGVGFVDEVPEEQLDQIAEAVRVRLGELGPVELTFHRPTLLGEGVVLAPTPTEPLHQIWDEIRSGIAEVMGSAPTAAEQAKGFRPHVSLTYINAPGPARPYIDALSAVEAEPVSVDVEQVALIVQNRVLDPEWLYRWTTRTAVPLGAR